MNCKSHQNGSLTFDEFKNFILSEEGNKAFKIILSKSKLTKDEKPQNGSELGYVPTDFRSMLEFISWKLDRDKILQNLQVEDSRKNACDFQHLFKTSDINSKVNSNNQMRALKLMLGEAKKRANSTTESVKSKWYF